MSSNLQEVNECSLQEPKLVHTHIQGNLIVTENVCLPSNNLSPADGNYEYIPLLDFFKNRFRTSDMFC